MLKTFKNPVSGWVWALILFALFGPSSLPVFSQFSPPYIGWIQRYNGPGNGVDAGSKIAVDALGNVYVTGASRGNGTGSDIVTLKYDPDGNLLWERRYNGPANGNDGARDIELDGRGNLYVCGSSTGIGTSDDYTLIGYDTSGNQRWVARFNQGPSGICNNGPCYEGNGPNIAERLAIDSVGSIYVTGTSFTGGLRTYDWVTLRYDLNGNLLGDLTVDIAQGFYDWGIRVAIGPGNTVYTAGGSNAGPGRIIKFKGPVLWTRDFFTSPSDMTLDASGNAYLCGEGPSGSIDYAIFKCDSSGNLRWSRFYDGPASSHDRPTAITTDGMGNVYVTGMSAGNGTIYDYATVKYDSAGNQLWVARFNGPANYSDVARAIKLDANGNVYVSGHSYNPTSDYDYVTIKYDSQGNEVWVQRYNGTGNNADQVADLAVISSANVYVTGSSIGEGTNYDITTIKYSPTAVLKGDLDENGILELADIVALLNCVFLGVGSCPPAFADVNCDAFLTAADVVVLLNIFYLQVPSPC